MFGFDVPGTSNFDPLSVSRPDTVRITTGKEEA